MKLLCFHYFTSRSSLLFNKIMHSYLPHYLSLLGLNIFSLPPSLVLILQLKCLQDKSHCVLLPQWYATITHWIIGIPHLHHCSCLIFPTCPWLVFPCPIRQVFSCPTIYSVFSYLLIGAISVGLYMEHGQGIQLSIIAALSFNSI